MKRLNWLSLLAIVGLIFISCGNEPPEQFYNGTPEDDSLINNLLANNAEYLKTDDMFVSNYISVNFGPVTFPISDLYFKGESILVKHHVDSIADKVTSSSRFKDLWYTKDTTCTVYLYDTFNLIQEVHYDVLYKGYYFWDDTLKDLDKIDTIFGGNYYSYDTITAEGLRHLYVEPVKEKVWDKELGDSIWKIKEPREWKLKRISYGNYAIPNRGASVPYIYYTILTSAQTKKADTIKVVSYDTLTNPHAMNRFRHVDSLLEYNAGDSLTIKLVLAGTIADTQCVFFAMYDGKKYQLVGATGKIAISGSGVKNLIVGAFVDDAFYYQKPVSPLLARFWLIPVRVK